MARDETIKHLITKVKEQDMATIRENVVVLKSGRIRSVKVVDGSFVDTKGQPYRSKISSESERIDGKGIEKVGLRVYFRCKTSPKRTHLARNINHVLQEWPYDGIRGVIPNQYQGLGDMIGKPLFKELFWAVNVFVFRE